MFVVASYSSTEILALLKAAGWFVVATEGSHVQLKHDTLPGRVTVPSGRKDMPLGTVKSIFNQGGLDWASRKR
jgi:predicted RNA binding protein YcfA (HicA-like mRNA interferase family)